MTKIQEIILKLDYSIIFLKKSCYGLHHTKREIITNVRINLEQIKHDILELSEDLNMIYKSTKE